IFGSSAVGYVVWARWIGLGPVDLGFLAGKRIDKRNHSESLGWKVAITIEKKGREAIHSSLSVKNVFQTNFNYLSSDASTSNDSELALQQTVF
ncbi:9464_t:CDS:2, partial [Diversispora eburnea]